MDTKKDEPAPHEAALLLPWYLNGTLAGDELRRMERHLAECGDCRAEAAEWRTLRGELRAAVEARPAPSPDLFARTAARIGAYEGERRSGGGAWQRAAERLFYFFPARMAPALALALIVIQFAALGVMGGMLYRAASGSKYQTLSGPDGEIASARGARLRVAFVENAPEREIRAALIKIGARITGGPTTEGFYEIRLSTGADVERALGELQRQTSLVRFVEAAE